MSYLVKPNDRHDLVTFREFLRILSLENRWKRLL
jgi:plasmid replication initiation protein